MQSCGSDISALGKYLTLSPFVANTLLCLKNRTQQTDSIIDPLPWQNLSCGFPPTHLQINRSYLFYNCRAINIRCFWQCEHHRNFRFDSTCDRDEYYNSLALSAVLCITDNNARTSVSLLFSALRRIEINFDNFSSYRYHTTSRPIGSLLTKSETSSGY